MYLELTNADGLAVLANFDLVEQVSIVEKAAYIKSKLHFAQSFLYVREDHRTIKHLLQKRDQIA